MQEKIMQEKVRDAAGKFQAPYLAVAEGIAKDIDEGIYKPGGRIPSSRNLSMQYRVNKSTIKRAFEVLRQQNILQTVNGIGMVVAPASKPQQAVAIVIPKDYHNAKEFLAGVNETCSQNKVDTKLLPYNLHEQQEEIIMDLADSGYLGAILHPKFSDECAEELLRLKNKLEFPIALIGQPDQMVMPCWRVERNEFKAAHMATEHLIEQHFFRIGIVVSKHSYDVAFLNGYRQAMHEYNTTIRNDDIQYIEDEESPGDATRELLSQEKKPVKAILYAHPSDAVLGLEVMSSRNIIPGKNMGVVCFGDFPGSDLYVPPITLVRNDNNEIGRKAAKIIFDYLSLDEGRKSFNFQKAGLELIDRDSSKKNGKEPICLSQLQKEKRGLIRDRQARLSKYWRDVYHPGWWKTEPLGWEREELYYRTLYNNW